LKDKVKQGPTGEKEKSAVKEEKAGKKAGKKADSGLFSSESKKEDVIDHVGEMAKYLENEHSPGHSAVKKLFRTKISSAEKKVDQIVDKYGIDPYKTKESDIPPAMKKEITGEYARLANEMHEHVEHLKKTGRVKHPGRAKAGMSQDEAAEHINKLVLHYSGEERDDLSFSDPHSKAVRDAFDKLNQLGEEEQNKLEPHNVANAVDSALKKVSKKSSKSLSKGSFGVFVKSTNGKDYLRVRKTEDRKDSDFRRRSGGRKPFVPASEDFDGEKPWNLHKSNGWGSKGLREKIGKSATDAVVAVRREVDAIDAMVKAGHFVSGYIDEHADSLDTRDRHYWGEDGNTVRGGASTGMPFERED